MISPPTPEQLEADKKSIDDQFEKAFSLVDQLSKDTEALKAAEQQRTEKLDSALADLETVINDLKSSNRRREDEGQRIRDEVSNLKDSIPKALDAQKNLTDSRLQEVNSELKSLKTIISQRMSNQQATNTSNYTARNTVAAPTPTTVAATVPATVPTIANDNGANGTSSSNSATVETPRPSTGTSIQDYASSTGRNSPFSSGISSATVKIPEWQRAMATKKSSSTMNGGTDAGSSSQAEASGSGS